MVASTSRGRGYIAAKCATCSRTVIAPLSELDWSTMPMRARQARPPVAGSTPSTVADPPVRSRYPSRISMVVDLPAPFGPRSANVSPRWMSKETPRRAVVVP